jgi:hypothetical protein
MAFADDEPKSDPPPLTDPLDPALLLAPPPPPDPRSTAPPLLGAPPPLARSTAPAACPPPPPASGFWANAGAAASVSAATTIPRPKLKRFMCAPVWPPQHGDLTVRFLIVQQICHRRDQETQAFLGLIR